MDPMATQGRVKDIPDKVDRLAVQIELYAKNIQYLREMATPVLASGAVKTQASPSTPVGASTELGSKLLSLIQKMAELNEQLGDIISSMEV